MAHDFKPLLALLERLSAIRLPAERKSIGSGVTEDGNWWVKFAIDIAHPLAWRHVQELRHALS